MVKKDNTLYWVAGLIVIGFILYNANPELFSIASSKTQTTTQSCSVYANNMKNPSMTVPFNWNYTSRNIKCVKSYSNYKSSPSSSKLGCKITYTEGKCPCVSNWQCNSWTTCVSGKQTRVCTDSKNCGTNTGKPITSQSCKESKCASTLNIPGLILYLPLNAAVIDGSLVKATWNPTGGKFGDGAFDFNGKDSYIEVPDNSKLSPSTYGSKITISFWMKPTTFNFKGESQGYAYILGKGQSNNHEFAFRIYNSTAFDGVSRSKRNSFYAFNLNGGLGAGSYYQDNLKENEWVFVTGVIDGTNTKIYKNGVLRDTDTLSGYDIHMGDGTAPLRIGTRDFNSYFSGSIDEVRVYNRALTDAEISQIYNLKSCTI